MDEEFIAKLANLYNSFQNTLESKIKDKEISSNNEECYLIKDYDNKFNKIIKNYELCRKYNRYSFESSCSLPEPPDFINDISSMIVCIKNNINYKLIQKEVILLINKKNKLNSNKGQLAKYYTGNYKIIIEFIGKSEHKALLLDRTLSRHYTPYLIKKNNNPTDVQLYNDILSIKDNITSFLSRNREYNNIIISKEKFLWKKNLSPPIFNKRRHKKIENGNLTEVDEEKANSRNKRIGHRRQISDSFHRDITENIKVDNMAEGINNMTVKDAIEEKKEEEENKINEDDKEADLLNISNNKDIFKIELDNKKIEMRNDNKNISEQLKEKSKKLEILENEIKLINKKYAKREEEYKKKLLISCKLYIIILVIQKEKQDLINKLNKSKINNFNLGIKIKEKENELENLKNELNEKINQINNLKKNNDEYINKIDMLEKEKLNLNNKLNSQNIIDRNEMMCVNFISSDQYINYSIPCTSSDIFKELEEKLYKEYPKYRETEKVFLHNGNSILSSKTIEENKIESGKPILLNIM